MAYRNDVDALAARHEALQAEVDAKTRDRDEVSRLLEEARGRERNEQLYQDYASGGPQRRRRRRVRIALAVAAVITGVLAVVFALRVQHTVAPGTPPLLMMQHFADEMCQCQDARCAEKVSDEMVKWAMDQSRDHRKPPQLTEQEQERAVAIGERMGQCMQRAMSPSVQPPPHAQRYESQSGM